MRTLLFVLTLFAAFASLTLGCSTLKLAYRYYKKKMWRGFGPGRRLISTYSLYGGTLVIAYICFVLACLSESDNLFAISWGIHALSYAIASTLPHCKEGRRNRMLRIKRRAALTLVITVSVIASYLFAQH